MLHKPVLLNEVLQYLQVQDGKIYVDATFGAGGYSHAILQEANCELFAIDRDENALKIAQNLQEEFSVRFTFLPGKFSQISNLLAAKNVTKIDGICF